GCVHRSAGQPMKTLAALLLLAIVIPASAQQSTVDNEWWQTFNDPLLSSLVARALESNSKLRLAAAGVREARAQESMVASARKPFLSFAQVLSSSRGGLAEGEGQISPITFAKLDADIVQTRLDSFWEADVSGALRRSVKVADANLRAAEEAAND